MFTYVLDLVKKFPFNNRIQNLVSDTIDFALEINS